MPLELGTDSMSTEIKEAEFKDFAGKVEAIVEAQNEAKNQTTEQMISRQRIVFLVGPHKAASSTLVSHYCLRVTSSFLQ